MQITESLLPAFKEGHSENVYLGVIHYISCRYTEGFENDPYNEQGIIDLLKLLGYSYNYFIGRTGKVYRLVETKNTSYHCGKSVIAVPDYKTDLNADSISMAWAGMEGEEFTPEQYLAGANTSNLIEKEVEEAGIGRIIHWVGHDWISGEIAVRLGIKPREKIKIDPGPTFDWAHFYNLHWGIKLGANGFKKQKVKDAEVKQKPEEKPEKKVSWLTRLFQNLFGKTK